MDLGLAGKVAVVTGAGKGSGMAGERAGGGALGVAGSPSTDPLEGLERVTPVAVDLAAPGGPAELVARAVEEFGRVDVLVNNVGAVKIRTEGFFGTSDEEFEWAMQMNFFIALRTTRAALKVMVEAGSGGIGNIAPGNAFFQPDPGTAPTARRRRRSSTSPNRSRRSSARRGSASTRSPQARSRPTSGSASTASPRPPAAR